MKRYEKVVVQPRPEDNLVEHTCELCKKDMQKERRSSFDETQAKLTCRRGNHWPEGSFVKRLETDICADCMVTVVVPFLEEKGVRFRIVDEGDGEVEMKEPGVEFEG